MLSCIGKLAALRRVHSAGGSGPSRRGSGLGYQTLVTGGCQLLSEQGFPHSRAILWKAGGPRVHISNFGLAIKAKGWLNHREWLLSREHARKRCRRSRRGAGPRFASSVRWASVASESTRLHRPHRACSLDVQRDGPSRLAELSERLRLQRECLKELRMLLRQQRAKHLYRRYLMAHPKAKA